MNYTQPIFWMPVINTETDDCPPFAVVEILSVDASTGFANIGKPSASDTENVFFNGPTAIPANSKGQVTQTMPAIAAYQADNSDGADPAHDEQWGTASGSWYLHKGKTGFRVIGQGGYGLCNVQTDKDLSGSGGDLFITGQFASGSTVGYIRTVTALDPNTSTLGDTRGDGAIDFQMLRSASTQVASGAYATIIGSVFSTVTASNSVILGGSSNQILFSATNQYGAIVGGGHNTISGDSPEGFIGGGVYNEISGMLCAIIGGRGAKATHWGQVSQAGREFGSAGDGQTSVLTASTTTTGGTTLDFYLDGSIASQLLTIPSDTTWCFDILIVARRTDANNESAAYRIVGCIDNNAGTVALVGTVTKTVIAEDTAAWDVDAVADNTAKALVIKATGESGKTIQWVARVTLVETTG